MSVIGVLLVPVRFFTIAVPQDTAAYALFPLWAQAMAGLSHAAVGGVAVSGWNSNLRRVVLALALMTAVASTIIQFVGDLRYPGWVLWASVSVVDAWCYRRVMVDLYIARGGGRGPVGEAR